jgi:hypothetical protein
MTLPERTCRRQVRDNDRRPAIQLSRNDLGKCFCSLWLLRWFRIPEWFRAFAFVGRGLVSFFVIFRALQTHVVKVGLPERVTMIRWINSVS